MLNLKHRKKLWQCWHCHKVSGLALEEEKLKVNGGDLCPHTGYWQTPAQRNS